MVFFNYYEAVEETMTWVSGGVGRGTYCDCGWESVYYSLSLGYSDELLYANG